MYQHRTYEVNVLRSKMTKRNSRVKYERLNNDFENAEIVSSSEDEIFNKDTKVFKLKREIGVFSGVCLVMSMMIGSGIFVVPTGVLKYCDGDVKLSMVIWAAGGIIAMVASLCVCELGVSIPESGSWMTFLHYANGPFASFVFTWMIVLVASPEGLAAQIIALGEYMTRLHFDSGCDFPNYSLLKKLLGMLVALVILVINITRVKVALRIQIFCAFGKVVALIGISVAGFVQLMKDSSVARSNFLQNADANMSFENIGLQNNPFFAGGVGISGLSLALYQGLWAFDGFEAVTLVTEEVENPKRSLPTIMFIALPAVTALYLIVNVAYFSVLTPEEMLSSQAVAVTFGQRIHPFMAYLMTLSVCSSLVGSINGHFLATARIPFVAGRLGHMPQLLSMAHIKFYSPLPAMVLSMVLGVVMLFPSNFDLLVTACLFTNWGFRGLSFCGLLILRRKRKDLSGSYKVYTSTAILAILISIYLVIVPLVFQPELLYLLSIILLVVFCGAYVLVRKGLIEMTGIGKVGFFLQKLLQIAPTSPSTDIT